METVCTIEAGSHSIIFYPVFLKCSFSLTLFSGFCLFVLSVFLLAYLCLLSSSLVCLFILPVVHCSVLPCPLSIHKYSFLVFAFVLFFCLNYVHAALVTQSSIGADLLGGQILIVDVAQVRLCCHLFPPFFFSLRSFSVVFWWHADLFRVELSVTSYGSWFKTPGIIVPVASVSLGF